MTINEIEKVIQRKVYATSIAALFTILALIGVQILKMPFEGAQFFFYGFSFISGCFFISFLLSLNNSIQLKEDIQVDMSPQK